jgi:hypothetical protein
VIIRAGYDIGFECYQEVPMVLLLSVHPSREKDLLTPQRKRPSHSAANKPELGRQFTAGPRSVWQRVDTLRCASRPS